MHNDTLTNVQLEHHASTCIRHHAWQSKGLPVLPAPETVGVQLEWAGVLSVLRPTVRRLRAQHQHLSRCTPYLALFTRCAEEHNLLSSYFSFFAQLRCTLCLVLHAASACPIFGFRSASVHFLQPPARYGMMRSQLSLERASMQQWCHGNQRLRLLCCSCPLSTVASRLADDEGSRSFDRRFAANILKRCFSTFALRMWQELAHERVCTSLRGYSSAQCL